VRIPNPNLFLSLNKNYKLLKINILHKIIFTVKTTFQTAFFAYFHHFLNRLFNKNKSKSIFLKNRMPIFWKQNEEKAVNFV